MNDTLAAHIYNTAIEDALKEYKNGVAAIGALKKKFVVTVDHVSPYQSKQEVVVSDE